MNICAILPAAGLGQRFAAGDAAAASKIEFELQHKPVFLHAVEALRSVDFVGQILLAVHPDRLDDFRFRWEDKLGFLQVDLVAGGTAERWETVKLALDRVEPLATHVAVHDAARPVVSPELLHRLFEAAQTLPAVVPGLPVSSTLKRVGEPEPVAGDRVDDILGLETAPTADARPVLDTADRRDLVAVQTPQVFEADLLRRAYAQDLSGLAPTDDAGLVEQLGETVHVIEGDPGNLKITHPGDVELAEALLSHRRQAVAEQKAVDLFGDEDD